MFDDKKEDSKSKDSSEQPIDAEAGQPPTPSKTKAMIIDQEMNRHGMCRYQWCVWAICGTGLWLDVTWFAIFSYAAPSMQRELGYSDKEYGNLFSSFSAGLMAGAAVWGILVDIMGRRLAFLGTCLTAGIFGICLGALSSYPVILVFVAFTGFGVGGNVPIDSTITVEFLPEDHFFLLPALSFFQPLAYIACSLISYGFIPNYSCQTDLIACHLVSPGTPCCSKGSNMGWRYMLFTIGAISLGLFVLRFFIFPFYESPKFLLTKGKDQEAVDVVRKIAAFNKRPCELTLDSLRSMAIDSPSSDQAQKQTRRQRIYTEVVRLKLLFANWRVARVTILIWITWMFDYLGFGIAGSFLPTILQRKNIGINKTLQETYRDYFIVYCPGLLAVLLAMFLVQVPALGRKWTLVLSSMLMGVSLFLYSVVTTEASHVGFHAMEYFFQTLFNAVLFGWTPEAFPAAVRGSATGLASFLAGLLGVSGPLIAAQLFARTNGSNSVLYLAGSGIFVCTICLICIPTKSMLAPRW